MKQKVFFLFFIFSYGIVFSQQQLIDSLNRVIRNPGTPDTSLAAAYSDLSSLYYNSNIDSVIPLCNKVLEIAEKAGEKKLSPEERKAFDIHTGTALSNIGSVYYYKGDLKKAVEKFEESLVLFEKAGDVNGLASGYNNIAYLLQYDGQPEKALSYYHKSLQLYYRTKDMTGMGDCLNNMGLYYQNTGDLVNAMKYYHRSLKLREQTGNQKGVAETTNNIASLYDSHADFKNALIYYNKALVLSEQLADQAGIAAACNNIGYVKRLTGDLEGALENYTRSVNILSELGDNRSLSITLNNIGRIYYTRQEYEKAMEYYLQSLKLKEQLGDKYGLVNSYYNIGLIKLDQKDIKSAQAYGKKGLEISQELGFPELIRINANLLCNVAVKTGDFREAYEMRNLEIKMIDSITDIKNVKAIAEQQAKYEYEKKAATDSVKAVEEKKITDAQIKLQQAELEREKAQRYTLYGGVGVLFLFGGFMYNRFRVTRKQKTIIHSQKEVVESQMQILEEKNREILDSINYAKRLQDAILPPAKLVKEYLDDSFILYLPKDIVAGDFYWFYSTGKKVLFAAADCTGHGVPGAMVSVVCSNALNRAVKEFGITEPGKILDKVRELVIETFEKSENVVKDGMDIALCALCYDEENKPAFVEYAGANNPLWIIRRGMVQVEELKADKQPVGRYDGLNSFTTHKLDLLPGDTLYIFSDGFSDQFGGEHGKKFKSANFKKLLLSVNDASMENQRKMISSAFDKWRGTLEQIDDVCVIGVRV